MTDPIPDTRPPHLGLGTLFVKFLGFDALAFGGPVTQIATLRHSLVEREHWVDPARFNRLLAVLQILPGPEAHELCVHLGIVAHGRWGGIVAGLGFMLPSLLLMMAAGWLYVTWIAGNIRLAGILLGVQIVVLAIIARALVRIGQHVIEDRLLAVIAVASLIATLIGVPFWIPLAAAGFVYALVRRPAMAALALLAAITVALVVTVALPVTHTAVAAGAPVTLAALFVTGLKGGLLTFGGAYTAIPYICADTVGRGWLSDATFFNGILS